MDRPLNILRTRRNIFCVVAASLVFGAFSALSSADGPPAGRPEGYIYARTHLNGTGHDTAGGWGEVYAAVNGHINIYDLDANYTGVLHPPSSAIGLGFDGERLYAGTYGPIIWVEMDNGEWGEISTPLTEGWAYGLGVSFDENCNRIIWRSVINYETGLNEIIRIFEPTNEITSVFDLNEYGIAATGLDFDPYTKELIIGTGEDAVVNLMLNDAEDTIINLRVVPFTGSFGPGAVGAGFELGSRVYVYNGGYSELNLGVGPKKGDINADGLVNILDFEKFQMIMNGPSIYGMRCDMDGDMDTDMFDFGFLQRLFGQ
jgi:hypothetical protein